MAKRPIPPRPEQPAIPPNHLALIIDGMVEDIMHTEDRLAAILLSEPVVVEIGHPDEPTSPRIGWVYDAATGEFSARKEAVPTAEDLA